MVRVRCPVSECDVGSDKIELHMRFISSLECWCTVNELGESWAVKIDLIKERYIRVPELGDVDTGHEFFKIFGNAFEKKFVESGEDRAF